MTGDEPDPKMETILAQAREMADPAERASFLDKTCEQNFVLRESVEKQIEKHVRAASSGGDVLTDLDPDATADITTDPGKSGDSGVGPRDQVDAGRGTHIGHYKLVEKIGEGGMGTVYRALQERPVRREVALKIIKLGMDTDQVIARFEAERQALALMDHQNIAKVLDAAATDTGRPYFVMDLVVGVPITVFCDRNHLSVRERIELFIPVCLAIQHAHQKGIIHRDVKPSNVLVALADGRPVPKVIDFGVAKAIDQQLTEKTMFTQYGVIVGTLEYMSPEQAGHGTLDVDTRSDVYSLGVLLYELLTGSTPLERSKLRQAAFAEVLRRIREEEPPKPSTRLSNSRDALPSIGAQRQTDPARLTKLVKGELDWIVMKSLEKDRTRRYDSARDFARDLERYLSGDPVEAGPPRVGYKLRKLARKHAAVLATAGAFAGLLVLAAALSSFLAVRASRAEMKARQAAATADLARQAEAQVRQKAEDERNRALNAEQMARDEGAKTKTVLAFFQDKVLAAARPKDQEGGLGVNATIRAAVDAAESGIEKSFAGQPEVEMLIRDTLGESYWYLGEPDRAIRQFERALALRRQTKLGPDHPDMVASIANLAVVYRDAGRNSESIPLLEEVVAKMKSAHGPDHLDTLTSITNLAVAYRDAGRFSDAIPLLKQSLKAKEAKLGPDAPQTLMGRNTLALAYRDAGRIAEALPFQKETLELTERKLGRDQPTTLTAMNSLALIYQDAGRIAEAVPLFEEVLKRRHAALGADHPSTVNSTNNLAVAYRAAGRSAEALPLLEQTLKGRRARLGFEHPETLASMDSLAAAWLETGRTAEAESLWRDCLAIRERKFADDWTTFHVRSQLGGSLLARKEFAGAEPLLLSGYDGMKARADKIPARYQKLLTQAGMRITALYDAWDKRDKADRWRKKLEIPPANRGPAD
jgi:eukaryotic-like serine/threonine-protein kinase